MKLTYINGSSLRVTTEEKLKQLLIFNINGHLVRQLTYFKYKNGDYIIKIITEEGVVVKRIIKLDG